MSSLRATALAGSIPGCRTQGPGRCGLQCHQPPSVLQRIRRSRHAAHHHVSFSSRRSPGQVSAVVVTSPGAPIWSSLTARNMMELARCFGAAFQETRFSLPSCAVAASEQSDGQPGQEATKRCLSCGNERTLHYFPVRKTHPGGWVHCYACQTEQRRKAKPLSRCAITGLPVAR